MEPLFYIQDTRTYCGNSVMWWRVDGAGYTTNLNEAWKVPASWKGRDTDKLWPCEEVNARATLQFDMQRFREIEEEKQNGRYKAGSEVGERR